MRAVPGVSAAAIAAGVPLTIFSGGHTGTEVRLDGIEGPTRVDYAGNEVGPGYFETMGIRLVRGRDFTAADRGAAARVVVINEEFARRYFKGLDPIGRRIQHHQQPVGDEIIGVVSNGKYRSLSEAQDAAIYSPLLGEREPRRLTHVLVRTNGDPETLAASVRAAILAADGSAAVTLTPMRSGLAFAMLPSQMGSAMLGLFGALGTTLAMVGLFGVISFAVSRRTAEIAIRVALGASRGNVLRLVLFDAGRLIASGAAHRSRARLARHHAARGISGRRRQPAGSVELRRCPRGPRARIARRSVGTGDARAEHCAQPGTQNRVKRLGDLGIWRVGDLWS